MCVHVYVFLYFGQRARNNSRSARTPDRPRLQRCQGVRANSIERTRSIDRDRAAFAFARRMSIFLATGSSSFFKCWYSPSSAYLVTLNYCMRHRSTNEFESIKIIEAHPASVERRRTLLARIEFDEVIRRTVCGLRDQHTRGHSFKTLTKKQVASVLFSMNGWPARKSLGHPITMRPLIACAGPLFVLLRGLRRVRQNNTYFVQSNTMAATQNPDNTVDNMHNAINVARCGDGVTAARFCACPPRAYVLTGCAICHIRRAHARVSYRARSRHVCARRSPAPACGTHFSRVHMQ